MRWELDLQYRVNGFDLEVALSGGAETVAIIGPNGAGKSTLLRVLAGALHPQRGRWRCDEDTLFDIEAGICVPPEHRNVGFVPQGYGLFPHLSVVDNIGFGWIPLGLSRAERHERAQVFLGEMGIEHLIGRSVRTLSGGEQQSVALARALAINPNFLILDEPLAALDAVTRQTLRTWLNAHLRERNAPTIVVTHDPRDVRTLASTVVVIEAGRVVQMGCPKTLASAPTTPFVGAFFGTDSE